MIIIIIIIIIRYLYRALVQLNKATISLGRVKSKSKNICMSLEDNYNLPLLHDP